MEIEKFEKLVDSLPDKTEYVIHIKNYRLRKKKKLFIIRTKLLKLQIFLKKFFAIGMKKMKYF